LGYATSFQRLPAKQLAGEPATAGEPKWENALLTPPRVNTERVRKLLERKDMRFALVQKRGQRERKSEGSEGFGER
jgi:hypothetical protein